MALVRVTAVRYGEIGAAETRVNTAWCWSGGDVSVAYEAGCGSAFCVTEAPKRGGATGVRVAATRCCRLGRSVLIGRGAAGLCRCLPGKLANVGAAVYRFVA